MTLLSLSFSLSTYPFSSFNHPAIFTPFARLDFYPPSLTTLLYLSIVPSYHPPLAQLSRSLTPHSLLSLSHSSLSLIPTLSHSLPSHSHPTLSCTFNSLPTLSLSRPFYTRPTLFYSPFTHSPFSRPSFTRPTLSRPTFFSHSRPTRSPLLLMHPSSLTF